MTTLDDGPATGGSGIDPDISVEEFSERTERWLEAKLQRKKVGDDGSFVWGEGEFDVSVFHAMDYDTERARVQPYQDFFGTRTEF